MLKNDRKQLHKHVAHQPKNQVPKYKNTYGTNHIFQLCVVSSESHIISVWTSCIFCLLFPHFPACYRINVKIWLVIPALYWRVPNILPYFCFSLSPSHTLSLSHTHVRSRKFSTCQPFWHALHTLYIKHSNFLEKKFLQVFLTEKGHHCFHFSCMVAQYWPYQRIRHCNETVFESEFKLYKTVTKLWKLI